MHLNIYKSTLIIILLLQALSCFRTEDKLPGTKGDSLVSGRVIGVDGQTISSVTVAVTPPSGSVINTTTDAKGRFAFTLKDVERGTGFNVAFSKTNFDNANRAGVVVLPSLRVDMGDITIYISGGSEITERVIKGQIFDNFSYNPLREGNVVLQDSSGKTLVAKTDSDGNFEIKSNYFAVDSDFAMQIYKSDYITRTDITAKITAKTNTIRNNPGRLYRKFGSVRGTLCLEEETCTTPPGAPNGIGIAFSDSNQNAFSLLTGNTTGCTPAPSVANNEFEACSDFMFLGERYALNIRKPDPDTASGAYANCQNRALGATGCYQSKTVFADITLTGTNTVGGSPIKLLWDSYLTGSVNSGGPALAGVLVKFYTNSNEYIGETTTDAGGNYKFASTKFLRSETYKMTFEKAGYNVILLSAPVTHVISIAGANAVGPVNLPALPPPTKEVSGTVKDFWSNGPVADATVWLNDDGGLRSTTTDVNGDFTLQGNYSNTSYTLHIAKSGYTGETLVAEQNFAFTHSGGAGIYNISTTLACETATRKCTCTTEPCAGDSVKKLYLYPIGIYANINGNPYLFRHQIKQSYEKFLTEKNGLTISARTGTLLKLNNAPDYGTFYVHFDNTPKVFPTIPEGNWSNMVSVNGATNKGYIAEGVGNDIRATPYGYKNFVFFHFYAPVPASPANPYVMETLGSTDTHMTLIDFNNVTIASDDDSGTGSNARISVTSLARGWHFLKIRGKNNNVYGFYDVKVTGPSHLETQYTAMFKNYSTTGAIGNGDVVISWYDYQGHFMYVAGPGEIGSCAIASIEKHGQVGEIVRGRFAGNMKRISSGTNSVPVSPNPGSCPASASELSALSGFFNVVRAE